MAQLSETSDLYSYDALAIVGMVSAVVHIIVRSLAHMYPKMTMTLLNIMIIVNISLVVYYAMAYFM